MSKASKTIVIIAVCSFILLVGIAAGILFFFTQFGSTNASDNNNPQKQEEMLSITLEWGRLAPLPDSKTKFQISTEGSAFTRSFRASFYLDKTDLDKWIAASPGLEGAVTESINDWTKKYVISPGGGGGYAEAVIDFDKCFVETYVYWN